MHKGKSFCRSCTGFCGTIVTVDDVGRIARVQGDRLNPLSEGYACIKGRAAPEAHNGPQRLLSTMKRQPDGSFKSIPAEVALDEVAEKLSKIIAEDSEQSVAAYSGTMGGYDHLASIVSMAFVRALGSRQVYTTFTIDQSAKYVAAERIGKWSGGRHGLESSDVWMLIGGNPLVSLSQWGFVNNPAKTLKRAKARGMKLIVIDPRCTETAKQADIFLQPYPGEDPTILAGMLRIILNEGWQDQEFCAQHVEGLEELRVAVQPFTPDYVAERAGIEAGLLRTAAEAFAHIGKRGSIWTSTGPSMAPRSNLSEYLVECINVVCGRFNQAGTPMPNPGVLSPRYPRRAHVSPPRRPWEHGPRSRVHNYGQLDGQYPTAVFADQVLTPGEGRIRAFFVIGGNPASAVPDQRRIVEALRSLDLLVTTDPVMSATARLAHYVFAPTLQYERPATIPLFYGDSGMCRLPYASWSPAIVEPPKGADVIDEWRIYWGLARRLGLKLKLRDEPVDLELMPASEELYELLLKDSAVPLGEIKRCAGQLVDVEPQAVEPGDPKRNGKFRVMAEEVAAELKEVAAENVIHGHYLSNGGEFRFLLTSRRMREVSNSMFKELGMIRQRTPYNPAFMHPADLAEKGLSSGTHVEIESDNGRIEAIVQPDPDLRRGVVSMAHSWGGLPDDGSKYEEVGSNVNLLISTERDLEPINAMPRMSAIPVNITAVEASPG